VQGHVSPLSGFHRLGRAENRGLRRLGPRLHARNARIGNHVCFLRENWMTSDITSLGETDNLRNTDSRRAAHRFCYLELNRAKKSAKNRQKIGKKSAKTKQNS
jgi:hypothetical protein